MPLNLPNYLAGHPEVTGLLSVRNKLMQASETRIIQLTLAIVWIVTGVLSLGIYPVQDSLALLVRIGIKDGLALAALYGGATLDIVMGILTLATPGKRLWQAQALIIIVYTLVITVWLAEFWLHPFGPILKNLPILALLWLLHNNEGLTQ
jgi:hypothetical protein